MMNWDPYKAKRWLLNTGMDHIRDGLSQEGGDLIYESKWGDGRDSAIKFKSAIARICEWDSDMIGDAIKEINESA